MYNMNHTNKHNIRVKIMAKVKMTLKDMRNYTPTVLQVGYCELQNITKHLKEVGYNAGIYGWNCDLLMVDDEVSINHGYKTVGNMKMTKALRAELKALDFENFKDKAKFRQAIVRIVNEHKELVA